MTIIQAVPEQSIAHYNLLEPIGREAIGQVYRARDTRVGRTVALKILDPALVADDTRRTALFDEARLAAKLSHPEYRRAVRSVANRPGSATSFTSSPSARRCTRRWAAGR